MYAMSKTGHARTRAGTRAHAAPVRVGQMRRVHTATRYGTCVLPNRPAPAAGSLVPRRPRHRIYTPRARPHPDPHATHNVHAHIRPASSAHIARYSTSPVTRRSLCALWPTAPHETITHTHTHSHQGTHTYTRERREREICRKHGTHCPRALSYFVLSPFVILRPHL